MIARLYLFPFGAHERAKLEAAVNHIAPRYREFPQFVQVSFFMDDAAGVCGTLSLWETRAAAEAATATMAEELTRLISDVASDAVESRPLLLPARLILDVYEPVSEVTQ
jgi:hypothetical protein